MQNFDRPKGAQKIFGYFKSEPRKNAFTPDNNIEKKQFYWEDISSLSKLLTDKTTLQPYLFYQNKQNLKIDYPRLDSTALEHRNNHLHYAYFWFSMAFICVMFYLLYHIRLGIFKP